MKDNMRELFERRYVLRQNGLAILGLALCFYFAYHLIQGDRSYGQLIGLQQASLRAEKEYETVKAEREKLEHQVVMLRPGSLNRDYLEERARAMLGVRTPEEIDILTAK